MIPLQLLIGALIPFQAPPAIQTGVPAGLVKDAFNKGVFVFAAMPKGVSAIPNTVVELGAWSHALNVGVAAGLRSFGSSSYRYLPRDFRDSKDQQVTVLGDVAMIGIAPATKAGLSPSDSNPPTSSEDLGDAVRASVFSGAEMVPEGAKGMSVQANASAVFLVINPATGKQISVWIDSAPKPETPTELADLRSSAIEELRAQSEAPLKKRINPAAIPIQSGVYTAKDLVDKVSSRLDVKLFLDHRFWSSKILFVGSEPISPPKLLDGICRSLDLFVRKVSDVYVIAVSPQDPYAFRDLRQQIDSRNYAFSLLKKFYSDGRVPNYVDPEVFLSGKKVGASAKAQLVKFLLENGQTSPDGPTLKQFMKTSTASGGVEVAGFLTVTERLVDQMNHLNRGTIFP